MQTKPDTQATLEHASVGELNIAARVIRKNAVQMAGRLPLDKIRKLVAMESEASRLRSEVRRIEYNQHDELFGNGLA